MLNNAVQDLHDKLVAIAEQYRIDAMHVRAGEDGANLARFFEGKADAYWNAASWLEELGF